MHSFRSLAVRVSHVFGRPIWSQIRKALARGIIKSDIQKSLPPPNAKRYAILGSRAFSLAAECEAVDGPAPQRNILH